MMWQPGHSQAENHRFFLKIISIIFKQHTAPGTTSYRAMVFSKFIGESLLKGLSHEIDFDNIAKT